MEAKKLGADAPESRPGYSYCVSHEGSAGPYLGRPCGWEGHSEYGGQNAGLEHQPGATVLNDVGQDRAGLCWGLQ